MQTLIVFSAILALASAGALPYLAAPHAAIVQAGVVHKQHVISEPHVVSHLEAIPASIPGVVPSVHHTAHTVPEHRFQHREWIQPTRLIIPAVKQHVVESQIPYAVESVKAFPTVQHHTALQQIAVHQRVAVPTVAEVPVAVKTRVEPLHGHAAIAAPLAVGHGAYGHGAYGHGAYGLGHY